MLIRVVFAIIIGIYAVVIIRAGGSRSLHCPKCRCRLPKLRSMKRERTVPKDGFSCERCGCKIDAFSNELSFPGDADTPEGW